MEYVSQKETPVGVCWTARSTFTAVWFAATVMEHRSARLFYLFGYFLSLRFDMELGNSKISSDFNDNVTPIFLSYMPSGPP